MDSFSTEHDGIAIIGMSGRFPGAQNVDQFWKNLVEGVDSISRFRDDELEYSVLTPQDKSRGRRAVAARGILDEVDMFDAEFFGIYPKEAEIMDPQHRIFLECAWESIESAGYDPYAYPGMIGVYAGASLNTYLLNNMCADGTFARKLAGSYQVGEYQAMLGNDKDFFTTRVSYKLNLKGPSMAIQTACSSSLVAISQACNSLMGYQCDMALAGGVSISFPQKRDYLYEEEGLASVDGTCRTFDSEAKGTVFGHGCAVVLLKRLSEAIEDGDSILAVIKGTAVNNDGCDKIGYAAPSVNAQADVISMALAAADVDPESISYIEAHGTGTPLGDPIEIAALTQAFRSSGATQNGFCAIGSGKPNISHLDVASGAVGLIKTVMQMRHGVIPRLLHFKTPNSNIDFDNSPFYPVAETRAWQRGEQPRRAGISAFGVGGTNAHVILEESPQREAGLQTQGPYLFPLSARTDAALAKMCENLAAKIRAEPELNLADVSYTLQVGRKSFEKRCALVAASQAELLSALDARAKRSDNSNASDCDQRMVFLFPGQGSQYVEMSRELYEREPIFRAEVDRCAELLQGPLQQDIRSVLYPRDDEQRAVAEKQLNETWLTQPAIFVVEYALAKLWQAWGVQPTVVVGHSIGEYVCAVLADSLSLEDALRLLAKRAKLMQALPSGSMLGVRLEAAEVQKRLPPEASIAADNSPKLCTVSGPSDVLERFQRQLNAEGIPSRMLATSHAFHSWMMDPMLEEFARECEQVVVQPPKLRWISTCTGRDVTAEDMGDTSYWSRQLRATVRFADALSCLFETDQDWLVLEVGPGRALAQFVRQHPAQLANERIVSSMVPGETQPADYASVLAALGKLWIGGAAPDWQQLHNGARRRVALPTYPFERKRFWVEPVAQSAASSAVTARDAVEVANAMERHAAGSELANSNGSQSAAVPAQTATAATTETTGRTLVSPREKIAQELKSIILNLSGTTIQDDEATFIDLGFDSLFLSQASQAIDARFGIKITFRQLLGDLSSISAIAKFLEPQLPSEMFVEPEPAPAAMPAGGTSEVALSTAMAQSLSLAGGQDLGQVQRLLDGHVHNLQRLLEQSRLQSASTGVGEALRVVRKQSSGMAGGPGAKPVAETKRFGPYKPIEKGEQGGLTPRQEAGLANLTERYLKRTPESKKYTAEHRPHFADPRAVAGFRSQWKEMVYPIVSARSKGSKIWDIDGNEYVDITMGFGTYFFGHSPDWLISAIEKQLHTGIEIGPQSPLAGEVAKMIAEFTDLERVTFCNTGSEAVMAAMRLARTVTGRNRIVYFAGDYHGMFEEVLVRGAWPNGEYRAQPIAPGIPTSLVENILVLEYGEPESLKIIQDHADEIAAVMVEPVQSRNPGLQPREFLHQVRAITEQTGAALIFDEVVTGFRCHPGGAQAYFGVQADMATYGKVVGGGMPIGILAGKPKYMDALDGGMWQYGDDSFPEVGVTFFAGTFVRHPLAIAAAHAVLKFLQEAGPDLQTQMSERVARVCKAVNEQMEHLRVPIRMSSFSAFAAIDYASDLKYASLLWYHLREKGIHIWEGRPCYFTLAHTDEDLQKFVDAFGDSVREMQSAGFLPEPSGPVADVGAAGQLVDMHSDRFPLAEGQREMWLGAQMSPEAAGPHHACNAFRLDGELDVEALRRALAMVDKRHEGLRCTFSPDGSLVVVQPDLTLDMPLVDLSGLPAAEREQEVAQIMQTEAARLLDLENGPLLMTQLLKLSETEHQLVVTAQMIVCDGWSHYVLFEELSEVYSAIREGRAPQLREVVPMREFVRWQQEYWQTPEAQACEDYWRSQYRSPPNPLELPTKGPRPQTRTVHASRRELLFSAEFYDEIKSYARKQKASSFAVLLAAFQAWLHRLSGSNDLVVGVPFAEQNTLGMDTLVGQCANTLPIRAQLDPKEDFTSLLNRTWDSLLDAQENAHYTFGRLIQHLDLRHDPSRIPLVSVLFNIDPAMTKVKFSGLQHHFFAAPRVFYQFDLGFNLVEEADGLRVECDFNTNLFEGDDIAAWLTGYESMLRAITSDQTVPLAHLPMQVTDGVYVRGSIVDLDENVAVHRCFATQSERVPEAIAVSDSTGRWTYQQLAARVNELSGKLQTEAGDAAESIGVLTDSNLDLATTMLAAWKTGLTVVPIDLQFSIDQMLHIVSQSQLSRVLVSTGDSRVNQALRQLADAGTRLTVIELDSSTHSALTHELEEQSEVNLNRTNDETLPSVNFPVGSVSEQNWGEQIALVVYQRQQSGTPVGVEISHRAVANLVSSLQRELGGVESEKVLALSPTGSATSLLELVYPLTVGAQSLTLECGLAEQPSRLADAIAKSEATYVHVTTTVARRLLSAGWEGNANLKLLVSGEPADCQLAERLLACCRELWLMHGQTESTICSSLQHFVAGAEPTLGHPISNTVLAVVDQELQPVPIGVPGELLVGGEALASGYVNLPELSAKRFVTDNTIDGSLCRFLRSGQRVKRRSNGELQYVGSRESMIMLQGRDVETREIESILRQHPYVEDAAVILQEELQDGPGLVVYAWVKEPQLGSDDMAALKRQLRQSVRSLLSGTTHPCRFVCLPDLPLTPHGHLDRASLPLPEEDDLEDEFVAATSETEMKLVAIWQDVMNVARVGVDDNFFGLGGQSLMAVRVFARIESELGRKLPLAQLFQAPTVAQLAAVIDDQVTSSRDWPSLVPIQPKGVRPPLFLVHGAGGNILLYRALAERLAPEQPLYGLQSKGLDGESEPLTTIEAMAAQYLREVRAVQPTGPYYLGGYCLGGTVAYEMAQQLQSAGDEVALVAMLDTYNFSRALKSSMFGFLVQKLRFHLGNFVGLRPRHMIDYLKEKIRVARQGEFANLFTSRPGFDVEQDAGRATGGVELQIQGLNDTAAETYLPKPYHGKLTLFKPRINYKFYPDPKMGWGDLVLGELEIVEFPFNPHAMLLEPYVEQLAEALKASMYPSEEEKLSRLSGGQDQVSLEQAALPPERELAAR